MPRETTNQFVQGGGWTGELCDRDLGLSYRQCRGSFRDQYALGVFPTPEDDIETVDIAVIPGMQEFRDVTIDWGSNEPASTTRATTPG